MTAQLTWTFDIMKHLEFILGLLQKIEPVFGAIAGLITFMALVIGFIAWHQSEERDIKRLWKYILIAGVCAVALVALFGLLLVYARSRSVVPPLV